MSTPLKALERDVSSKAELEQKHHAESESASSSLRPQKNLGQVIVLLDVDETLAISNKHYGVYDGGYRYHQPLIDALKRANITEVFLFTAYKLSSISKSLEDESIGAASRLKLVRHLESQGIQVKGVLTLLDPIYNRGIGAYYEDVIRPFEERVLQGENLVTGASQAYSEAREKEDQLLQKNHEAGTALDKARLFAYTKTKLSLVHQDLAFLFFDDIFEYLRQVEQANEQDKSQRCPLLTCRVKPQDTQADYQQTLEDFLIYYQAWQALRSQIMQSDKVQATRLVFSKLTKALEEILPISSPPIAFSKKLNAMEEMISIPHIPLAFPKKLDSIKSQFQLFIQNPHINLPSRHALSQEVLEQAVRSLATGEKEGSYKLWGYGDEPLVLPQEVALKILSEDAEGNPVKYNQDGNAQVSCMAGIFFKKPGANTLQPLIEAFIFELSQCLGGEFVAPTRLLVIEKPNQEQVLIQASLGVGEVGLDKVLMIPVGIQGLQELLGGKQRLLEALPSLISGRYFEEWLEKQSSKPDLSLLGQKAYFIKILKELGKEKWPTDFRERYEKASKIGGTKEENALMRALGDESIPWLKVWALIDRYPTLREEDSLNNLAFLPVLFEAINEVYPKVRAEAILQHAPTLLNTLSKRSYSQHFLLSLLTAPGDAKGDNFRVNITRDEQTKLPTSMQLIAIDSDIAFKQGYHKGKPQVKTVIYGLGLIQQPIEESIVALLKQTSPNTVLLQVFSKVLSLQAYYERLFARIYKGELDKKEAKEAMETLSIRGFFEERFAEKWLTLLPETFKAFSTPITHQELLSKQDSVLSDYYRALVQALDFDPGQLVYALYNRHAPEINKLYDAGTLLPTKEPGLFSSSKSARTSLTEISPLAFFSSQIERIYAKEQAEKLAIEAMIQAGITPPLAPIRLPVNLFVALFARYGDTFIHWLKSISLHTELFLVLSDKAGEHVSFREPNLLFHILSLQNPWLIEGLIKFGYGIDSRNAQGYTPLQFVVNFNFSMAIAPLIHLGSDTNLLFEDKTALSLAIEKCFNKREPKKEQYRQTIETLIAFGVPYRANDTTLGLECAQFYQKTHPLLCEALLSSSIELGWAFTLQAMSQSEKPDKNVVILNGMGLNRTEKTSYLSLEVYQEIFKEGDFPKENLYGRHNVTSVSLPITSRYSLGVHFKENPEFIGREVMVHELGKALFKPITPPVAVLKLTKSTAFWGKRERSYPVLATATVPGGLTLQDILEEPQELAKIEPESFAEAFLLALLINPEDGRGDNYMVHPVYHKAGYHYKIVPIDNDRSFVRPLKLNSDGSSIPGPKGLGVKNVLYCLENVSKPLALAIIERFLQYDPYTFLQKWLKTLSEKQEAINSLFSKSEHQALEAANVHLQMVFKPSVIADIFEKFKCIQYALRENPYQSGMALLSRVIPSLGYRYREAYSSFKTPKERFDHLTQGCFEVSSIKKSVALPLGRAQMKTIQKTSSSMNDIVKMTGATLEKKSRMETLFTQEEPSTPLVALECLEKIHQESSSLEKIQQEIYQGVFKRFLELQLSHQQAIINGEGLLKPFDFSLMKKIGGEIDISRQEKFLGLLGNLSFTVLRIYRCNLRGASLKKLLKGSKETLAALEINDCGEFSSSGLLLINLSCPRLEKLGLVKLSFSGDVELEKNPFNSLRVFKLESCTNITVCCLNAPALERMVATDLSLTKLTTQSQVLRILELRKCKQLPERALYAVSASFSSLKKVTLKDCSFLNAFYYENYPEFLSLPLKEENEQVLNQFFSNLHQALQGKFLWKALNNTESFGQILRSLVSSSLRGNLQLQSALRGSLQLQSALDDLLESGEKRKQFFAATLLICSHFQFLNTLNVEVRREKVIHALLAMVGDKKEDAYIRSDALSALGEAVKSSQMTSAHFEACLKVLLAMVGDKREGAYVRRAALSDLGEAVKSSQMTSAHFEACLKVLLAEVGDKEEYIRQAALSALGEAVKSSQMTSAHFEACLKVLLAGAGDKKEDAYVRRVALSALGEAAKSSHMTLADFEACLKVLLAGGDHPDFYKTAQRALGEVVKSSQLTLAYFEACLKVLLARAGNKREDAFVQLVARGALEEAAKSSQLTPARFEACLKALLAEAGDYYDLYYVREDVQRALGEVVKSSQLTLAYFEACLKVLLARAGNKREDTYVRSVAQGALGESVKSSHMTSAHFGACLKVLLAGVGDKEAHIRRAALSALGEVVKSSQMTSANFEACLKVLLAGAGNKEGDENIRLAALNVLGEAVKSSHMTAAHFEACLTVLLAGAVDHLPSVRETAQRALGEVVKSSHMTSTHFEACLTVLLAGAEDHLPSVRETAQRALEEVVKSSQLTSSHFEACLEVLLAGAVDHSFSVRETAQHALGEVVKSSRLTPAHFEACLTVLLAGAEEDNLSSVHETALSALGEAVKSSHVAFVHLEACLKVLLARVGDHSSSVCEAAQRALGEVVKSSHMTPAYFEACLKVLLAGAGEGNLSSARETVQRALGEAVKSSHMTPAYFEACLKVLLAGAGNKEGDENIRLAALNVLGEAVKSSQMTSAHFEACLKVLLAGAGDRDLWYSLRGETVQRPLGEAVKSSHMTAAHFEACLKIILETLPKIAGIMSFNVAVILGKTLGNQGFIKYLRCEAVIKEFTNALSVSSEIQEVALLDTSVSSFNLASFQGCHPLKVTEFLAYLRRQYLNGSQDLDSLYDQNVLNFFLGVPLLLEQDFHKQLFEITSALLAQNPPWHPNRIILPILEHSEWSVLVLDCDYKSLTFHLLWDSPGNNNLNKLLPAVKSMIDRLVQSYQGVFQASTLTILNKKFTQQSPLYSDSDPIVLQNVEDYLKSNAPLNQFAESDKLYTIKQFNPALYPSAIQAVRLKHRTLLVDATPDAQLGLRDLFFKYTKHLNFSSNIESLVAEYYGTEETAQSILPLALEGPADLPATIQPSDQKELKEAEERDRETQLALSKRSFQPSDLDMEGMIETKGSKESEAILNTSFVPSSLHSSNSSFALTQQFTAVTSTLNQISSIRTSLDEGATGFDLSQEQFNPLVQFSNSQSASSHTVSSLDSSNGVQDVLKLKEAGLSGAGKS